MPPNTLPPGPPANLDQRDLPIDIITVGTPVVRIHQKIHPPLYFGQGALYRFDAPDKKFGVCYTAHDLKGAFAETCLRAVGDSFVSRDYLEDRYYSTLIANRDLRLVRLYGPGLSPVGATAAVTSGDYSVSQAWSKALYSHPNKVDGIAYKANHDNDQLCYALFDKVEKNMTIKNNFDFFEDINLIGFILDHYRVALG